MFVFVIILILQFISILQLCFIYFKSFMFNQKFYFTLVCCIFYFVLFLVQFIYKVNVDFVLFLNDHQVDIDIYSVCSIFLFEFNLSIRSNKNLYEFEIHEVLICFVFYLLFNGCSLKYFNVKLFVFFVLI